MCTVSGSGAHGLMDRVFAVHIGKSTGGTCTKDFSDPIYPAPSVLRAENSCIRVAVCECSVTEHRLWRLPVIKPAKLYMCTQIHYKHDEDGFTVAGLRGHGSVQLSHSGNFTTRIGLQQHQHSFWFD